MVKSMRCKREKRLRAIKREMVAPLYEKKEEAKLAALEAAMNAPKLPVRTRRDETTTMDASTATPTADIDVEMDEGNQTANSLKSIGRKLKKKLKLGKKKYRGKGKIRKKNV
ncbi:hypothetical protein HanRHA438_Chr02g0063581 [Helianthus annuus]|uniref:Uncharacterized protein n=1 Tax=Helianthus annuus TaxID=4232 RepID=A0A9K3JM41_HELAN|nr:uncharacterized protein LOC110891113 [Helianthus annuus]KAF5818201.1 hypothetical protein HanXRQr2_Chr02g0062201 [Helianthus annuus]KAJ0604543.1 hypothetical protein HanHA300_Chr02g0051231 [Helianthus annuus]KAJ0615043.1 hypothetical protein HanIR_Chr02g0069491 [Helianthus annuus]KAJ0618555.1 hypothetical protein HanHA89_Chr02g0054691 [Helianthus annuus]KAJ0777007.1 hypothetical protein HanLR1_Chr02g0052301 [Helianthus annuus]